MNARLGWFALGSTAVCVGAFAILGKGGLLNFIWPILCVGWAVVLLSRPGAFVTFVLGVWTWAPAVRRIADWQSSYNPISPVLAAPVLATAVCIFAPKTMVRGLRTVPGLMLAMAALCGGLLTGLAQNSVASAVYGGLTWIAPLLFAAYIAGCRNARGELEGQLLSSAALLAFSAALYGIFQFLSPPVWDRLWMIGSQMPVIGSPAPFKVRVFGPLNSPVPFAAVMVAGLLAAILDARKSRWLLAPPIFVALLLSLVRSEWIALVVSFVAIVLVSPARAMLRSMRIGAVALGIAVASAPLLSYPPIATAVLLRMHSLNAGGQDVSYRDRMAAYRTFQLKHPVIGEGLGSTDAATRLSGGDTRLDAKQGIIDSALLHLATSLGIPLSGFFLAGLVWLAAQAAAGAARSNMATAGFGLAVAGLSQLPSYNVLVSGPAVLMYAGFALSARYREPLHSSLRQGIGQGFGRRRVDLGAPVEQGSGGQANRANSTARL